MHIPEGVVGDVRKRLRRAAGQVHADGYAPADVERMFMKLA